MKAVGTAVPDILDRRMCMPNTNVGRVTESNGLVGETPVDDDDVGDADDDVVFVDDVSDEMEGERINDLDFKKEKKKTSN